MWLDTDLQQRIEVAREQFEALQARSWAIRSQAQELEARSRELQWKSQWVLEFGKRPFR